MYGTALADGLRKIEWRANSWQNDTAMTPATTDGVIEWVELTSRTNSDQIGIAYSDDADDVSGHIWTGQGYTESDAVIATTASTLNTRKFDVAFEGTSGDMFIATQLDGAGTWELETYSGGTWGSPSGTTIDQVGGYLDLADNGTNTNYISGVSSNTNVVEASSFDGTALDDDTSGTDTTTTTYADSYELASVSYLNSTHIGVMVYSDTTDVDDINWYTMSTAGAWTAQTDNTRSRGTIRNVQLYDYPVDNKVMLVSSDSNSDLWVDTLSSTGGTWIDLTSGGTLENSLASAVTQNWDFAFRLDSQSVAYTEDLSDGGTVGDSDSTLQDNIRSLTDGGIAGDSDSTSLEATRSLTDGAIAGDEDETTLSTTYNQNLSDGAVAGDSITTLQSFAFTQNLSDGGIAGDSIETSMMAEYTQSLSDGAITGDSITTSLGATRSLTDGAISGDVITADIISAFIQNLSDGAIAGDSINASLMASFTQNLSDGAISGDLTELYLECVITCTASLSDGTIAGEIFVTDADLVEIIQRGNAIKLYLNTPTESRLGGVFVFTCPAGEWAYGITSAGELLCADPTP